MSSSMKFKYRAGSAAIPRTMLSDERLSIETRGALSWMMSHSTDFVIRRDYMMKVFKCGRHKFDKMINEAKDAGYLRTITARNELQQFHARYELAEVGFSDLGKPDHLSNTIKGDFATKFLSMFPTQPKNRASFEFHLQKAICEVGTNELVWSVEKYQSEVANRVPKRKPSLPENWLRDGGYLEVIE